MGSTDRAADGCVAALLGVLRDSGHYEGVRAQATTEEWGQALGGEIRHYTSVWTSGLHSGGGEGCGGAGVGANQG